MLKKLFYLLLASMPLGVLADDAPHVEASVFCETFDGTSDVGGNDGIFSFQSAIGIPIIQDAASDYQLTNAVPGAQCVRFGDSSGALETTFLMKAFPFTGDGRVVIRGGGWNSTTAKNQLKCTINSIPTTLELTKGSIDDYSVPFTGADSTMRVVLSNAVKSKASYVFVDDITIFKTLDLENDDCTELSSARKVVLSGAFTLEDVTKLNVQLAQNTCVVTINAKDAVFPEGTTFSVGNPNALIYSSATGGLANGTSNVVIDGMCENFVLTDGDDNTSYPFYAEESFKATNVSYDRKFVYGNNGYYSSVYLPFTIKQNMNLSYLASLSSYDSSEGVLSFYMKSEAQPNEPCIIRATSEQPFKDLKNVNVIVGRSTELVDPVNSTEGKNLLDLTFNGVYTLHRDIVSGTDVADYARFGLSNGQLKKVSSIQGIFKPFRAFVTIPNWMIPDNSALCIKYVVPTDVKTVRSDVSTKYVYDLNGRCMPLNEKGGVQKGIYVVDGKKYYVK